MAALNSSTITGFVGVLRTNGPSSASPKTAPGRFATAALLVDKGVGLDRVNPQEQTTLAAPADRHIAVDQEGKAAEHALLGQPPSPWTCSRTRFVSSSS
jgi:hypothetical protein